MPILSIITATYNASQFLQECLDSVAKQNTRNCTLEHIVVDGNSDDDSINILKAYASRQNPSYFSFRYISESDQGQADAFNKGITIAKGDWICWLNADDLLAPGTIEAFEKALLKNPDADIIYGHVQFIHEDSSPAWISYQLPYFYPLNVWGCYAPPSVGTFFRRDLFLREPLDINYHYVMDVEWFLRCGRGLKMVLVDQVFSHFRISAKAKTSEMIRSGKVTERHFNERENYRRKYVYSRWPNLTEEQARKKFEQRRKLFLLLYKAMKMRYAWRYLEARRKKVFEAVLTTN